MKIFEPQQLDFTINYKLLIGAILPRPIAFVSTLNADKSNNVAPFSFFTAISAHPMIIAFCPMVRTSDEKLKDTVVNIEREKEFIINFVTEDIIDQVNFASTEFSYGVDEFVAAQLTPLAAQKVKCRRVAESPVHFECIFRDQLVYGSGKGSGRIITGEVVAVHVDEKILVDGKIITSKFKPVGRGAGNDWILCDHLIQRERLTKVQIQK